MKITVTIRNIRDGNHHELANENYYIQLLEEKKNPHFYGFWETRESDWTKIGIYSEK